MTSEVNRRRAQAGLSPYEDGAVPDGPMPSRGLGSLANRIDDTTERLSVLEQRLGNLASTVIGDTPAMEGRIEPAKQERPAALPHCHSLLDQTLDRLTACESLLSYLEERII